MSLTPPSNGVRPLPASRRGWPRRLRLMVRNAWLIGLGGVLLFAGLGAVAFYVAARPSVLRIAIPHADGEDMRLVQALAQQFSRDRASIRLRPVVAEGPLQSAA